MDEHVGIGRRYFPWLLGIPLLFYVVTIVLDASEAWSSAASVFDDVTAIRFASSLALSGFMTFFAVFFGIIVYLGYLSMRPKRRFWLCLTAILPLSYPTFGVASAWMTAATLLQSPGGGRVLWTGNNTLAAWLQTTPGTAAMLALCFWPIPFFFLLQNHFPSRSQVESARLSLTPMQRLRYIYSPAWRQPLLLSGALLFCLGMIQFEAPSLMQVQVYPLEIFIAFSSLLDEQRGVLLCLPYLGLVLVWAVLLKRGERLLSIGAVRADYTLLSGRTVWFSATLTILLLSVALPLISLLLHARAEVMNAKFLLNQGPIILRSLFLALTGSALIVLVGLWYTYPNRIQHRLQGFIFFLFFFCIPGILIASSILRLRSNWQGRLPNGIALLSMLLAYGIQYFILGAISGILLWRMYGVRTREADALVPLNAMQKMRHLYWPALARPALLAVLLTGLFIWRDIALTILLHPPGYDTLAMQYFGLLHYGSEPRTAAIGFLLMFLPSLCLALTLGMSWAVHRRYGSRELE